jgi:hypothetical protein
MRLFKHPLIQEAFIDAKVQVPQLDFACIVAAEPAKAWHGVVLLADAKAMEMESIQSKPICKRT